MKFRIPSIILGILLLGTSFCFGHGDEEVAEISTKPSIVALATVMKSFRASLSSELLDAASYPLGHKESYSWTNTPPGIGRRSRWYPFWQVVR